MSMRYVTKKLKSQTLGDLENQNQMTMDDSGSESEMDDFERQDVKEESCLPKENLDFFQVEGQTLKSYDFMGPVNHADDDNYSSEEELKEIISSKKQKKLTRVSRGGNSGKRAASRSKGMTRQGLCSSCSSTGSRSSSRAGSRNILGSNNNPEAHKRKWSEVANCEAERGNSCSNVSSAVIRCRSGTMSAPANARIFIRPNGSSGESFSCSSGRSSLQSDEHDETPIQTPVQFCTSPPLDVHKPTRQSQDGPFIISRSPPQKVFHLQPQADFFRSISDPNADADDDEVSGMTEAAGREFIAMCDENIEQSNEAQENVDRKIKHRRSHSHNRLQTYQGLRRYTPSPNKRQHLTSRSSRRRHIQRPCLDFEKMQQIKKRVVTSWRPQGGELSLFCW